MATNRYFFVFILLYYVLPCSSQPNNTSGTRAKVVSVYTSQIGVRELTGKNDGKSVETYLRYVGLPKGNPWCAAFVCWTYGQTGVVNPKSGYCPELFTAKYVIYKRTGSPTKAQPQQGDIFGLYFVDKKRIAHTGFVDKWTSTTTSTVEGNTNQAGSREGDGVYRKIRLTRQIYAVSRFIK